MPWHIETDNPECAGGFAVVKDDDGQVVGCHESEESAQDQLTALNIAESGDEERDDDYPGLTPRQKMLAEKYEKAAELFGQFDQGTGPDGAHYMSADENPFSEDGLNCAQCVAFRGGGACEWVAGEIDPGGLCKLWVISSAESAPVDAPEQDDPEQTGDDPEEVASVTKVTERAAPLARVEWRESGAGPDHRTIVGYAAVFNSMSQDLGGFREVIAPGAFSRALAQQPDLRLLYNHNAEAVLARTRSGSLEVVEDDQGLRMWARVDMSDPDVQRVIPKMMRKDVDEMSFAFTVEEDDWEERDGYPLRTIRSVGELFEVSITPWGAYSATKAEVLERAMSDGRVRIARATPTVADQIPGGSESQGADALGMGRSRADEARIRAAKWRARLSHHRLNTR
jgi:uncharacterized protein